MELSSRLSKDDKIYLRKGQKVMTYMLKIFDRICRKHNIRYILWGGNIIGAHYYNSWVPWDADVDVMIYKDDHEKFKSVVQQELPDRFWYQSITTDKKYKSSIEKIRYLDAYYEGSERYGWHGGLQLDITTFRIIKNIFVPSIKNDVNILKQQITMNDTFPLRQVNYDGVMVMTFNNYEKYIKLRYHPDKKEIPKDNNFPVEMRFPHEGKIIFGVSDFHKKAYPELYK